MGQFTLTPLASVLKAAEESSKAGKAAAIGAFNVNFFTQAEGVMEGLRRAGAPAVIQASKGANEFQGGPDKIAYMVIKAGETSGHNTPICLHLDHGDAVKGEECVDSGYTGIMIDASKLSFADNVCMTRGMVAYAHARGVGVEGEYGLLKGIEEDIVHEETTYADPELVVLFFQKSNADALAIAYGTSHGPNKGTNISQLRTEIVRESYQNMAKAGLADSHYLVGHGSSTVPKNLVDEINSQGGAIKDAAGVPPEKIKEGIAFGLRKVNIDTDLRLGITAVTRTFFNNNPDAAAEPMLAPVKKALDENVDAIDPRKYLVDVKPFETLREPPADSGCQAFVDLMVLIKERIADHVEFLVHEFGCDGLADKVERVTPDEMKKRYAAGG